MSVDWTVDGNNSFMRVFREKDIGEEETSGGGGGGDKMSALLDFCDSFTKKATLLHNPLVNAPKRSFIMGEEGRGEGGGRQGERARAFDWRGDPSARTS